MVNRRSLIHWVSVVAVNLALLILVDYLFGSIVPDVPEFNSKVPHHFKSNYRSYFRQEVLDDGEIIYVIPHHRPVSLNYESSILPKNAELIFAFGDSFTAGAGVAPPDAWPKQLETMVQIDGMAYYISNYGIPGFNIREVHDLMQQKLGKAKPPSLVVYGLVLNDPMYFPNEKGVFLDISNIDLKGESKQELFNFIFWRTHAYDLRRHRVLQWFYRRSFIARYFISQWEIASTAKRSIKYYHHLFDESVNAKGTQEFYLHLDQMKQLVENKGSKLLVMIFPLFYRNHANYPFSDIHQKIESRLKEKNIEVLDLLPFYRTISDRQLWVHPTDQHPNNLAHQIAAKALKNWIEKNLRN